MESIDILINDTADLVAMTADMIIAWSKMNRHKPELILLIAGEALLKFGRVGKYEKYKPKSSGYVRQMSNEELADYIATAISYYQDHEPASKKEILEVLNEEMEI